tara:strand:- start:1027 stop:1239 length:213 start_codon:yes stop_codon:yes gene_type:complete
MAGRSSEDEFENCLEHGITFIIGNNFSGSLLHFKTKFATSTKPSDAQQVHRYRHASKFTKNIMNRHGSLF